MDLVAYAHERGQEALTESTRSVRKALGQFMTPPPIARTMARRACSGLDKASIRILDPAAGSGILAAAVVEELLQQNRTISSIEVVTFECDPRFHRPLTGMADKMRRLGKQAGVEIRVRIIFGDFLMSDTSTEKSRFDVVIANPPYFKLGKDDKRATKHSYAVYGQPNIYGLFMAACARLLTREGRWCFITPRSWTNGAYFREVRQEILRWLHLDAIHVFESRTEHFAKDEILQEAMITWASAQANLSGTIVVSVSDGAVDLPNAPLHRLSTHDVLGEGSLRVISLPHAGLDGITRRFTATLSTYGIKVSTGPVVAFRASEYISQYRHRNSVPLLWMQHVDHMRVTWPLCRKCEHILANGETAWMLVPNANMVILRRFSPKEDARRVMAAPFLGGCIPGSVIGLENHTNYIYRPGGTLETEETIGLSAYLNSRLVDKYFRGVAGNTQVNAADLRRLPLPSQMQLTEIGRHLKVSCSLADVDRVVCSVIGIVNAAKVA